jgi:hypothetical protein
MKSSGNLRPPRLSALAPAILKVVAKSHLLERQIRRDTEDVRDARELQSLEVVRGPERADEQAGTFTHLHLQGNNPRHCSMGPPKSTISWQILPADCRSSQTSWPPTPPETCGTRTARPSPQPLGPASSGVRGHNVAQTSCHHLGTQQLQLQKPPQAQSLFTSPLGCDNWLPTEDGLV